MLHIYYSRECYIEGMDEVTVFLHWKREEFIFSAYAFGMYTNEELGNITMTSAGLNQVSISFIYVFDINKNRFDHLCYRLN